MVAQRTGFKSPLPSFLLPSSAICAHRRELAMLVPNRLVSHSVGSQTNSSPRDLHAAVSVSTRCGMLVISPNRSQLRTLTRDLVSCSHSGTRGLRWCTLLARYVWAFYIYIIPAEAFTTKGSRFVNAKRCV